MPRRATPRYDPTPIRGLMRQRGMTYSDLAAKVGVTRASIGQSLWRPVSWSMADRLACALDEHPAMIWPSWMEHSIAALPAEDPWEDHCRIEFRRPWWSNCRAHQGRQP